MKTITPKDWPYIMGPEYCKHVLTSEDEWCSDFKSLFFSLLKVCKIHLY